MADSKVADPFLLALRPPDVARLRRQLADWWSIPGEYQGKLILEGRRRIPGWQGSRQEDARMAQGWLADTFRQAELYWVSPEMCDVLTALAPTIPDCTPQPPVEMGFVLFAKSIPGMDAKFGGQIHTSACLWGPMEMYKAGMCLAVETYVWRDLSIVYTSLSPEQQERWREVMPTRLMPTGGSDWHYSGLISEFLEGQMSNETMQDSIIEDRRLLATFWALCSQKIAIETRERPSRQVQRQAERQGRKLDEVRVINLREPQSHSANSHSDVEWSHRWIVGRHWRNQWYPSTGQHAPKLIEAYVKGPEDKPLKVRETVRALVR